MPDVKGKRKKTKIPQNSLEKLGIFSFCSGSSPHIGGDWGVPKVFNFEKKTRQSTDLEEYDFVVPKNFT